MKFSFVKVRFNPALGYYMNKNFMKYALHEIPYVVFKNNVGVKT